MTFLAKNCIIFFKPLAKEQISQVLDLLVKDLEKRLEDKHLRIELTKSAKDYIIENGYNPIYGARPLKRFMQKSLETLIARKMLEQEVHPNETIEVDYDGELKIRGN